MQISGEQITFLVENHIRRYTGMINSHSPNVRVGECIELLSIWECARLHVMSCTPLGEPEKREIRDAIWDGELPGVEEDVEEITFPFEG